MLEGLIAENIRKQPLFAPGMISVPLPSNAFGKGSDSGTWKIIVADDDQAVHDVTRLLLRSFKFEEKPLEILNAFSGEEAVFLLAEHPDTAIMLLDVVMEEDDAGLAAVQRIREELKNSYVRIILRTGQPGLAPESEVTKKYDINDYREKSELTAQRLYSCLTTALRSYRDIRKIEKLAYSKENLEQKIQERTSKIIEINNELEKSQGHLAEAQQLANLGSWEWELVNDEVVWSDQLYRIIGSNEFAHSLLPNNVLEYVPENEKALVRAALQSALHQGSFDIVHQINRVDGETRCVRHKGLLIKDANGEALRLSSVIQDITEQHATEASMRKFSRVVQQIADSVMITDVGGNIEYVNNAFENMTGYCLDEVIGKQSNILRSGKHDKEFYKELWETIIKGKPFHDIFINRKKNGELYYEVKTISPLMSNEGAISHFISSAKDITERMLDQERLEHMAHHDALTGLPNRVLLKDRLLQLLSRKDWSRRMVAVLFLDLDRFKTINDTLGHDVGDELLIHVSERLQGCIREGDTVARLGGDEFAIVLNDVAKQEDIDSVGTKIIVSMQKPMYINGNEIYATTSIGISRCPGDAGTVEAMLKHADVALYKAKSMGKNTFQYYSETDRHRATNRFNIEQSLREAFEKNQFRLVYQPKYSISSGKVVGIEALLRCDNGVLKGISPANYIDVLEDTGLIIPVGAWVLHQACADAQLHQDFGIDSYSVSVNLSVRQFLDKSLIQTISKVLSDTGMDPCRLELEITESLLIEHISETAAILKEINDMGVKLSIDDFGTGYSSLSYLKRLPLDTLKIDRSFVSDVDTDNDDAAITIAIINLAKSIGLQVIAEGVETRAHYDFLKNNGCDCIQGYLVSRPVTHEEVIEFMKITSDCAGENFLISDE